MIEHVFDRCQSTSACRWLQCALPSRAAPTAAGWAPAASRRMRAGTSSADSSGDASAQPAMRGGVRVREVEPWIAGDYVAFLTDGRKLRVSRNYRDALLAAQR